MNPLYKFGRVVVVYGGDSAERDVSIKSGKAVLAALQRANVEAIGYDFAEHGLVGLQSLDPDRVFIAMHGRGGEDGTLQGALEVLGIPYTGSGVLASAVGMDKWRTKLIWKSLNFPTPDCILLDSRTSWAFIVEQLGLPLVVKPVREGSTLGIHIVESFEELEIAYHDASKYDTQVMAEKFVKGDEYTVSLLGDAALPAIRIEVPNGLYDYDAKYVSNNTRYHLPCGLSIDQEAELSRLCRDAFLAVGAKGWGRVDVIRDSIGVFWLIEVNTSPGMTDHSLVPQSAEYAGINFESLVLKILEMTIES